MAQRFDWMKINRLRRASANGSVSAYADLDPPRSWSEAAAPSSTATPAQTKDGHLIAENERLHALQAGKTKLVRRCDASAFARGVKPPTTDVSQTEGSVDSQ